MTAYIVNEVLCVLVNNFGKVPRTTIINIFTEFFTEDELTESKRILLDMAEGLSPKPEELKKVKASRVGEEKIRRITDDVVQLYTVLDNRQHAMPCFYVANTARVPSFKDVELCSVTASISELMRKVSEISEKMSSATDLSATVATQATIIESIAAHRAPEGDPMLSINAESSASSATVMTPLQWSTIVSGKAVLNGTTKVHKPTVDKNAVVRRKVVGSRPATSIATSKLVSSVPKLPSEGEKMWHIFVGGCGKDCTADDIKEFLEENHISVSTVRKLDAKEEWQKKHSAYRVSVAMNCKDSVMEADLWPDNVTVRDWFFKPK